MTLEMNGKSVKAAGIPKWLVALVDISLANLGIYFSFFIFTGELQGFQIGPLVILLPAISVVTVLLFSSLGLYSRQRSGLTPVVRALITGVLGLFLFTIIFAFMTRVFLFQRMVFLVAPLLQFLLLLGWRILFWRLELWIHGQQKLLIIGSREDVDHALEKLMYLPAGLFDVVRVLDPQKADQFTNWLPAIDAVMIAGPLEMEVKNRIIRECFNMNREVFIVPELYEIILTKAAMTQVHDTPVVECRDLQLTFSQIFFKRIFDLLLTLLLMAPALLLLALTTLFVRLSSSGPIIYSQERVGLRGHRFTLYKLRTMIADAEDSSGPVFSTEADDRVTKIGRFLRATRLDELPQLYNVLRGDISIVGPRPERPYFVEKFEREMPEYSLRHLVKPGITGLAQVAGYYATNTHDKLRYDLYYLSDYSLLLDLRILILTVPTLFNKEATKGVRRQVADKESL